LLKALHAQIPVHLAKRTFDHALARQQRAFDDDFGVGGNE
jgi:hypothetical protein